MALDFAESQLEWTGEGIYGKRPKTLLRSGQVIPSASRHSVANAQSLWSR
jgi:hypothetical protein